MGTSIPEQQTNPQQTSSTQQTRLRHTSRAAKSGKARVAKKGAKAGKPAGAAARPGTRAAKVLHLLQRTGGATLKDLMKATDWQAHSVRGFLSGTLRKKMGLTVTSTKSQDGERSYAIKG